MHAAKLLQSCLSLCNPMDSSLPGSSAHEILQARILEWVATPSPSGSSGPRDWIYTSSISYFGRLGSLPLAPPGKPTQSLYRFLLFLFISLFSKVTVHQISLGVGGVSPLPHCGESWGSCKPRYLPCPKRSMSSWPEQTWTRTLNLDRVKKKKKMWATLALLQQPTLCLWSVSPKAALKGPTLYLWSVFISK